MMRCLLDAVISTGSIPLLQLLHWPLQEGANHFMFPDMRGALESVVGSTAPSTRNTMALLVYLWGMVESLQGEGHPPGYPRTIATLTSTLLVPLIQAMDTRQLVQVLTDEGFLKSLLAGHDKAPEPRALFVGQTHAVGSKSPNWLHHLIELAISSSANGYVRGAAFLVLAAVYDNVPVDIVNSRLASAYEPGGKPNVVTITICKVRDTPVPLPSTTHLTN